MVYNSSKPERFYYSQLSAAEQEAYMAIRACIYGYQEEVRLYGNAKGIDRAEEAFFLDHPLLFFVKRHSVFSQRDDGGILHFKYVMSKQRAKQYLAEIKEELKPIVLGARAIRDKQKRITYLYDTLAKTLEYAPKRIKPAKRYNKFVDAYITDPNPFLTKDYSLLGPVFEHIGVCAGISKKFQYLCNQVGIFCLYVRGMGGVTDRGPHAWNLVRINDKYSYCDLTFDLKDDNSPMMHKHFLLSATQMSEDHSLSRTFSYPRSCYMGNGILVKSVSELPAALRGRREQKNSVTDITFTEPQSYEEVRRVLNSSATPGFSYFWFPNNRKSRYLTVMW